MILVLKKKKLAQKQDGYFFVIFSEGMLHGGSTMPSRTGQTVLGQSQPQAWQPGTYTFLQL